MLHNVAVVILNGFTPFELGVVSEVFGVDRTDDGLPAYDFAVVSGETVTTAGAPAPLTSSVGFTVATPYGLERLQEADLVVVSAVGDGHLQAYTASQFPAPLVDALRATVMRGARVLSVCNGAFVLGAAGLLDGRHCTTHWRHAHDLAREHPSAIVNPDVLYVDEDPIITSAGTAAGIDACLHLVRKEQGTRVANGIARRMVVPPHRDGGQAQYIHRPVAPTCGGGSTLRDLLEWLQANLGEQLTVRQLAARANMSERTLARRFVQDTGTTPQRWLIGQRILLAQQLLEETDETVDAIATHAGFGTATALRHHFRAWRGTTPNAYRHLFRGPTAHPSTKMPD